MAALGRKLPVRYWQEWVGCCRYGASGKFGWKAAVAVATHFAHAASMTALLRRIVGPLVFGTTICATLFYVWLVVNTGGPLGNIRPAEASLFFLIILPFETIGLVLLLPIALYLCSKRLPRLLFPVFLMAIGALLGIVVVLPISDTLDLMQSILPAACGAVSALVWFAFNRDAIKRRT